MYENAVKLAYEEKGRERLVSNKFNIKKNWEEKKKNKEFSNVNKI